MGKPRKKYRVAFVLGGFGDHWLGGVNYYRNLFAACERLGPNIVEPVVFVNDERLDEAKSAFGNRDYIRSKLLRRGTVVHAVRRAIARVTGKEVLLQKLLESHGIDISSHGPALGRRSRVPSLIWIPDMQHLQLKGNYTAGQIAAKNAEIRRDVRNSTGVIVSSDVARRDFLKFNGSSNYPIHVLKFVPTLPLNTLPGLETLRSKYRIPEKYIFLPNQYWVHKNHIVVARALAIARKSHQDICVISTGAKEDFRAKDHFMWFSRECEGMNLGESYRSLGIIPYNDMLALMRYSHFVINPSRFEGWSTTVEEAKQLKKQLVLSDIPVHREQCADRAIYFALDVPVQLSSIMSRLWPVPPNVVLGDPSSCAVQTYANELCEIYDSVFRSE